MVQFLQALVCIATVFLFNSCSKETLSPDAPENELISRVRVFRNTQLIQEVQFEYDRFNRIQQIDISNFEGNLSRELVRYRYENDFVELQFSFVINEGEEDAFQLILLKDAEGYIQSIKVQSTFLSDTQQIAVIRDSEKYMIQAVDITEWKVLNEYSYNEFGLLQTRMLSPTQGYFRSELVDYDLLESFVPGINDLPLWLELARDGYPYQPPYLLNTGLKSNPIPRFLPKTRSINLNEEFINPQVFSYDYARDKKGRMIEVRKYSPDLLYDVRMFFEYVKKQ